MQVGEVRTARPALELGYHPMTKQAAQDFDLDYQRLEELVAEWVNTNDRSVDVAIAHTRTTSRRFFESTRIDSRSLDEPVSI